MQKDCMFVNPYNINFLIFNPYYYRDDIYSTLNQTEKEKITHFNSLHHDLKRRIIASYIQIKILKIKSITSMENINVENSIFNRITKNNVKVIKSNGATVISKSKFDHFNIILKTGKTIYERNNILHEFTIGYYLNKLTSISHNFPMMYGFLACSTMPYILGSGINKYMIGVCNADSGYSTHIIMEEIENSKTLKDVLKCWIEMLPTESTTITKDIFLILLQIFCAISVANKHLNFIHCNLDISNILIEIHAEEILHSYQLFSSVISIRSHYTVKIINYKRSTIRVNGVKLTNNEDTIPWVDIYTIVSSIATYLNHYFSTREPDTESQTFIENICYLFKLIVNYSEDDNNQIPKLGEAWEMLSQDQNLPEPETIVFTILKDNFIHQYIGNNVSMNEVDTVYNYFKIDNIDLKPYISNELYSNDEYDNLCLSQLYGRKYFKMNSFKDRVDVCSKFLSNRIQYIDSKITGKITTGLIVSLYIDDNTESFHQFVKYSDIFMIVLDTAMLFKDKIQMMKQTLNDVENIENVYQSFQDLIKQVNTIIDRCNTIFSELTRDLYHSIKYIIEDSQEKNILSDINKNIFNKIMDCVNKGYLGQLTLRYGSYSYVKILTKLSNEEIEPMILLIPLLASISIRDMYHITDDYNIQSFISKVLCYEHIHNIDCIEFGPESNLVLNVPDSPPYLEL